MPYNNKVQVVEGGFTPLNSFEDMSDSIAQRIYRGRKPEFEYPLAQKVISENMRKLLSQKPALPQGHIAEFNILKDNLEISFDNQEIAQAFMQRLQRNGIKARYEAAGEHGSRLVIEHNEAPKLLQGILKMSDAQMENCYNHAKVPLPPQVGAPQMATSSQPSEQRRPPPRAPTIVQGQGGFEPLSAWEDSHVLGSGEQSPSLTHNLKSLIVTQTTHRDAFGSGYSRLNQNGSLDIRFSSETLTSEFLDKLRKNDIIAQAYKNQRRTGPDVVDFTDTYTITIDSRDVPKFLQGILKMPDNHLQFLYDVANRQPRVRQNVSSYEQPPQTYTPKHSSQSATLQTRPSLSASNLSMHDLYQNLMSQSENLGIKVRAGNIVNNKFEPVVATPGSFKAAEIVLGNQQNAPVCLAQEKQGGIDYSLGKNVTGANRNAAIEKVCQLAVKFGKNTEYAFPENADEKATFQSLNNALKAKFGEGYPTNPDPEKLQRANMTKEEMPTIRGYEHLIEKYPPPPRQESRERNTL